MLRDAYSRSQKERVGSLAINENFVFAPFSNALQSDSLKKKPNVVGSVKRRKFLLEVLFRKRNTRRVIFG